MALADTPHDSKRFRTRPTASTEDLHFKVVTGRLCIGRGFCFKASTEIKRLSGLPF